MTLGYRLHQYRDTHDIWLQVTSVQRQTHVTPGYLSRETDTRDTRLQVTSVQRETHVTLGYLSTETHESSWWWW